MAVHTTEQREFIVRRLAEYYTATEISEQFRARWPDTACTDADVLANDIRAVVLPPELFTTFSTARAAFDAALAAEWPELPPAIRVTARGLQRDIERARNRSAIELAAKCAAELTKLLSGFYAGKNVTPPATPDTEPVGRIEHVVIDPKAPPADANTPNSGSARVPAAAPVGAI